MEPGTRRFCESPEKKDQTNRKFGTPGKKKESREDYNSWKKRNSPAPRPMPIYKLSVTSMVRNISTGQLGLAAWLCSLPAPAHLLISWTWETGKSPWFLSNNWKHQCYQHSSCTRCKAQKVLGGKLTLPQPKPGQCMCKYVLRTHLDCTTSSTP